jgi:hypothetical protein
MPGRGRNRKPAGVNKQNPHDEERGKAVVGQARAL